MMRENFFYNGKERKKENGKGTEGEKIGMQGLEC